MPENSNQGSKLALRESLEIQGARKLFEKGRDLSSSWDDLPSWIRSAWIDEWRALEGTQEEVIPDA